MGHRSHRNEWRTVGGPHALVFLEANQPRQSLVDPGINHGFEPHYGFEIFRRISPMKRVFRTRTEIEGFNQGSGKVLFHIKERLSIDDFVNSPTYPRE